MMLALAFSGFVAIVFGLLSFYATDRFGLYAGANLAGGCLALAIAAVLGARRWRGAGSPHARAVLARGLLRILVGLAIAISVERVAQWSGVEFDFTQEGSFDFAPATLQACNDLSSLRATLFYDPLDPRVRRTRVLLATLARQCDLETFEQVIDDELLEVDRFEVASSNTVVLESGNRFETIGRPSEGTIFEGLYRLRSLESGVLTVLRGDGEGDLESDRELGYSGLASALETEGYRLQNVVSPSLIVVPEETTVLLALAPKRRLPDTALDAIRAYLAGGGRLIALLEPGVTSGLESVLAEFGMTSPNGVVIDPMFSTPERDAGELSVISNSYETHPVTRGLNRNRMTFFPRTRAFHLHKPQATDKLVRIVLASHRSWISEDPDVLEGRASARTNGARRQYHSIVAAGRYEREGKQIRIVAFGSSQFASNRHLRTLFNLDVILNAVHWAAAREPEITIRPKIRSTVQFPLPIASTLGTLYGVGLLVPEILLVAGGVVWLRRRHS